MSKRYAYGIMSANKQTTQHNIFFSYLQQTITMEK